MRPLNTVLTINLPDTLLPPPICKNCVGCGAWVDCTAKLAVPRKVATYSSGGEAGRQDLRPRAVYRSTACSLLVLGGELEKGAAQGGHRPGENLKSQGERVSNENTRKYIFKCTSSKFDTQCRRNIYFPKIHHPVSKIFYVNYNDNANNRRYILSVKFVHTKLKSQSVTDLKPLSLYLLTGQ